MTCHRCGSPMYQHDAAPEKWWCGCGAWRAIGESLEEIHAREAETARVLALLDAVIEESSERQGVKEQRDEDAVIIAEMESMMGQTIQTRGCEKCGGTMYRVVETDSNGNPINSTVYVCQGCGNMGG